MKTIPSFDLGEADYSWKSPHRVPMVTVGVLVLGLVFPSLITWIYFVNLAEASSLAQQAAWGIGKSFQFLLPVAWILGVCRRPLRMEWKATGLGWGAGFGLLVVGHAAFAYFGWLRDTEMFRDAALQVQSKMAQLGIGTPGKFLAVAVFYALLHSGLEEYYWRWFVFGELNRVSRSVQTAAIVSSLGFAAHHVILLGVYFGFRNPITWLFSAGVAVGGYVWALIYERCDNLSGAWLSHLLVDAMLFAVGFDLAFRVAI